MFLALPPVTPNLSLVNLAQGALRGVVACLPIMREATELRNLAIAAAALAIPLGARRWSPLLEGALDGAAVDVFTLVLGKVGALATGLGYIWKAPSEVDRYYFAKALGTGLASFYGGIPAVITLHVACALTESDS